MRFFDEKKSWVQLVLLTSSIVAIVYCSSYVVIRATNTSSYEKDGCPIRGCERVDLPTAAYYFYNPLVHADRYIDWQTEFDFH